MFETWKFFPEKIKTEENLNRNSSQCNVFYKPKTFVNFGFIITLLNL